MAEADEHLLPALLDRNRAVGAAMEYTDDGTGLALSSGTLSQEAYRIVQEGLGNALKHARGAPIPVHLTSRADALKCTVTNPMPPRERTHARARVGGGVIVGLAPQLR